MIEITAIRLINGNKPKQTINLKEYPIIVYDEHQLGMIKLDYQALFGGNVKVDITFTDKRVKNVII